MTVHIVIPDFEGHQGEIWKELRRRNRVWHRDHPQERDASELPSRRSSMCTAGAHEVCSGLMARVAYSRDNSDLMGCLCDCHVLTAAGKVALAEMRVS